MRIMIITNDVASCRAVWPSFLRRMGVTILPRSALTLESRFKGLKVDLALIEGDAIRRPDLSPNDPIRHVIDRNFDDLRIMAGRTEIHSDVSGVRIT